MTKYLLVTGVFAACFLSSAELAWGQDIQISKEEKELFARYLKAYVSHKLPAKEERAVGKVIAELAAKAAHPTNSGANYLNTDFTRSRPREGSHYVSINVEYFGGLTGKTYQATVILAIKEEKGQWSLHALDFDEERAVIKANGRNMAKLKDVLTAILEDG